MFPFIPTEPSLDQERWIAQAKPSGCVIFITGDA